MVFNEIYKKDPKFAITENPKVSNLIVNKASGGSQ